MATQPFSRERWSNGGESTLNVAASISDSTITVNDGTVFPATSRFDIVIDDTDIHTVTQVSSNTFTVDPVISTNHAQFSTVKHVLTDRSIQDACKEASQKLLHPMNRILDKDGNTLTASDFTWFNQGSATCVDADDGGLNMTTQSEPYHEVRGKYISAPSTPWTLTARCEFGPGFELYAGSGTGSYMGLYGGDSSGAFYFLPIRGDVTALWQMDDENTFNADVGTFLSQSNFAVWMQLEDDGVDVIGRVSYNGYDYLEQWSETRDNFLASGITRVGFGACSGDGRNDQLFHFKSWILE